MPDRGSYWLTRFVILRLLGAIYAVAFLVAANQILPLIGSDGLLPLDNFLDHVHAAFGSSLGGFYRLPSLFWFNHSDAMLVKAGSGVATLGIPGSAGVPVETAMH